MTHGSLFAGIGGFDEGFRRAGFETKWQVEIEPFPQAVLRSRFQGVELHSDVRQCTKRNLSAVDVVTAGFPCQDLSVAGKRRGLAGARSGLFWETHRILGELAPPWFVIENVPGLFSSNQGRDFAYILDALDELGYGLAWRVLNSQFFGVAQRRRRVFIVGRFGKPCPPEVLFESEGGQGDIAESGEAGEGFASEVAGCLGSIGDGGFSANCEKAADGYLQVLEQNTQCSTPKLPSLRSQGTPNYGVAHQISASAGHHGHSSPRGDGSDNLIAAPITASYGKQVDSSDRNGGPPNLVSDCLDGSPYADRESEERRLIVAFAQNQRGELRTSAVAPQLTTGGGKPGEGYSAVAIPAGFCIGSGASAGSIGYEEGMSPTLRGGEGGNKAGVISSPTDSHRVRNVAGLPSGMDSARYRALGNAVTVSVAEWIAKRIANHAHSELYGLGTQKDLSQSQDV